MYVCVCVCVFLNKHIYMHTPTATTTKICKINKELLYRGKKKGWSTSLCALLKEGVRSRKTKGEKKKKEIDEAREEATQG